MVSSLKRLYPEFPPIRPQGGRLVMVGLGNVAFILGYVAFEHEMWTALPWLMAVGGALKLAGFFLPERSFFSDSN